VIPFTSLTPHFWTLSVEEQFYLFWPAVILLAPRRHLFAILLALIISAPIYRLIAQFIGFSQNGAGTITIACLDCLGAGALLAYLRDDKPKRGALLRLGLWFLPVPLLLAVFGTFHSNYLDNLARTPCALTFAWIIARYTDRSNALLRSRALVAIGVVSYGAYIFHLAAGRIVRELYRLAFGQHLDGGPLLFALGVALTLVIAALSWKLFEEPINSLKSRWPYAQKEHRAIPETDPAADARS
jgi:peptidoglycan/LPS O-acetylase OafA/YrhL